MNLKKLSGLPVVLASITLSLSGCSLFESSSDSSVSPFNLLSSPFASSSDSSRTAQEKYEQDVADYTAEFVTASSGTVGTFRDHLGQLAQSHGIVNWESDRITYLGIGEGLKKAHLSGPQLSAFTESLSDNDPMKKQAIEDGLKK